MVKFIRLLFLVTSTPVLVQAFDVPAGSPKRARRAALLFQEESAQAQVPALVVAAPMDMDEERVDAPRWHVPNPKKRAREERVATPIIPEPRTALGEFRDYNGRFPQVYFTAEGRDSGIHNLLEYLIAQEKDNGHIKMAMFYFTKRTVAQALVAAARRGVRVEVIGNKETEERKSFLVRDMLTGVPNVTTYAYDSSRADKLMHHKFVTFKHNQAHEDNPLLWTGSFNLTGSAPFNRENVMILNDKKMIAKYKLEFSRLRAACQRQISARLFRPATPRRLTPVELALVRSRSASGAYTPFDLSQLSDSQFSSADQEEEL